MNVQSKVTNALDALLLSCVAAVQMSVWVLAFAAAAGEPVKPVMSAPSAIAQVIETVEVRG